MKIKYIAVIIAAIAFTTVMAEAGNGNGNGKQKQEQKKTCTECTDSEACTQTDEQKQACKKEQKQEKKGCGACSK